MKTLDEDGAYPNDELHYEEIRDYKYPYGLDFTPKTALHDNLVEKIIDYARESHDVISLKHPRGREIDKIMQSYMPASPSEMDLRRGTIHRAAEPSKAISIITPDSFIAKETALAHIATRLLMGAMFQFAGHGPEDQLRAKKLEIVCNQQASHFGLPMEAHYAVDDGLKYGASAVHLFWEEEKRWVSRPRFDQSFSRLLDGTVLRTELMRERKYQTVFEGTKGEIIDWYDMLPDPNVPIEKAQTGRFFGMLDTEDIIDMREADGNKNGYFNIDYLRVSRESISQFQPHDSGRGWVRESDGSSVRIISPDREAWEIHRPVLIRMFMKLYPRDWHLGTGNKPEIWSFVIANDSILIKATKHEYNHGMFPIAVLAPDCDGHSIAPASRCDQILGLQELKQWLVNSRMANIRKAVNNAFVYNPKVIRDSDMRSATEGWRIRMRSQFWGKASINDAIKQLEVSDVTANHMVMADLAQDWLNRAFSTPDNVQGIMRAGGERRSAMEAGGAMQQAQMRLDHMTWKIEMQLIRQMAFQYCENTQQFMKQPTWIKSLGDWPQELMEEYGQDPIQIDPMELMWSDVPYDIVLREGSDTMGGEASAALWLQMFQTIISDPTGALGQAFDPVGIFKFWARRAGARNVQQFYRKDNWQRGQQQPMNAASMPDEEVMRMAERGDIVPMNEAGQPPEALPAAMGGMFQ